MIPIIQTKTVIKNSAGEIIVHGNCFPACIASILELPISEVPNFEVFYHLPREDSFYWEVLLRFLSSKGWEITYDDRFKCFHLDIFPDKEDQVSQFLYELKDQYYLVSGKSSRGFSHIVIYQNGKMVHDPYPSNEGILTLEEFYSLEKIIE